MANYDRGKAEFFREDEEEVGFKFTFSGHIDHDRFCAHRIFRALLEGSDI